jgi:hypothetical protein
MWLVLLRAVVAELAAKVVPEVAKAAARKIGRMFRTVRRNPRKEK